jgi:cytochrome c556
MFVRLIIAVLAIGFGLGTVMAQQDPVKTREDLMKKNNDHAIAVVKMMRGQQPFDAAAVDAAFKQWADTAHVLPSLFPENSKSGGDNRASPKIWVNEKDFDEKAAAFGKAVMENHDKAKSSLDGLKAAIPVVGKACDDCHKEYRLSKQ